jgi:hypothetical protein
MQAFWFPTEARLLTRTYWNPLTPAEGFDLNARKVSFDVQRRFVSLLMKLMPPQHTAITLNAVDRYQRIIGLEGTGEPGEPSLVMRVWLPPTAKLISVPVENALSSLSVEMAGRAYPTLDFERLKWVEALTESDMKEVVGILDTNGVQYSDSEFKSH